MLRGARQIAAFAEHVNEEASMKVVSRGGGGHHVIGLQRAGGFALSSSVTAVQDIYGGLQV